MKIVRYEVRALNRKGKVVKKRTFKVESRALEWARKRLRKQPKVTISKTKTARFAADNDWGNTTTRPAAPKPVDALVVHHSVTKQLSPNASVKQERAEMRAIQSIGYSRGLAGFPYGYAIFPSGRIYRGSGFGVVEAATGGYNTSTDSVVLPGNYDVFKPTPEQLDAIVTLGEWGQDEHFLSKPTTVAPHHRYKATACPGRYVAGDGHSVASELPRIQKRINKP